MATSCCPQAFGLLGTLKSPMKNREKWGEAFGTDLFIKELQL
jgi:hypothetical protein